MNFQYSICFLSVGNEGRAGMAAIASAPCLDLCYVYKQLSLKLPVYARPVFIRIMEALDMTGNDI